MAAARSSLGHGMAVAKPAEKEEKKHTLALASIAQSWGYSCARLNRMRAEPGTEEADAPHMVGQVSSRDAPAAVHVSTRMPAVTAVCRSAFDTAASACEILKASLKC
jgi:hypothetical protein